MARKPLGVSRSHGRFQATVVVLRSLMLCALCIAQVFLDMPALAQTQGDMLAQIVVTAQKRREDVQSVPMSISVLSGATLNNLATGDFRDVLLSIPGLSYSSTEPGQTSYSIRGVSTGASSPTTGLYVDDVSLVSIATNFSGATDLPLFDLARIEVLKGPQGTLYGGSAMGGAIKYVTQKADLNQFEGSVAGGVATSDGGAPSYNGQSVLNVPIVPGTAAMRADLFYREDGGYINYVPNAQGVWMNRSATNPPTPYSPETFASGGTISTRNANSVRNLAGRLSFNFLVAGDLSITPEAIVQRIYEAAPPWYWGNLPNFEAAAVLEQPTHDNLNLFILPVTKPFGHVTLTSLTGYWDRYRAWNRDYTFFVAGLIPPLLSHPSPNSSDTDTKTFSQEFRLASNESNSALKWLLGVYYQRQTDQLSQVVNTYGAGTFFGTGTDMVYSGVQATEIRQIAAFGNITYALTPKWQASVGLRYFDIDEFYHAAFAGIFNGGTTNIPEKQNADVGFSPRLAARYQPSSGHMLYASASKGFRPGGPNRFNTASPLCAPDFARLGIKSAPASYTSDKLWTYEVGTKNRLESDRMLVDAAIYYTDWKDIQQQVNLPTCGFQFIGNVGSARIEGAELDFKAVVVPGVVTGANATYTDSRISSTVPGVSAQVGQPLLDTPKWSGNVYLTIDLPTLVGWRSHMRVNYSYHGSNLRQFDATSVVALPSGGSSIVPSAAQLEHAYKVGSADIEFEKANWQVRLYVDNFTNAAPILDNVSPVFNTESLSTLRPRTIGVMTRVSF